MFCYAGEKGKVRRSCPRAKPLIMTTHGEVQVEVVGQLEDSAAVPRYPLDGPQNQSGRCGERHFLEEIEPQSYSLYTVTFFTELPWSMGYLTTVNQL